MEFNYFPVTKEKSTAIGRCLKRELDSLVFSTSNPVMSITLRQRIRSLVASNTDLTLRLYSQMARPQAVATPLY